LRKNVEKKREKQQKVQAQLLKQEEELLELRMRVEREKAN